MIITNPVMKDNINIYIEPSVSNTSQVEDQYGKESSSNKLFHQAELEMAQQVPQREQKALKMKKIQNIQAKVQLKTGREKGIEQKTNIEQRGLRQRILLSTDSQTQQSSTNKDSNPEEIVDLVKDQKNQ